ncbi:MAG: biotin/lipoate A/B protein ligase family protein [Patescibacteria group bacterium]|jgi:lipoate-protein ligase A
MITFRLLKTNHNSAAFNMALDEILLERINQGLAQPCLRFYGWQPAAISIGYFQSLTAEVNVQRCQELGIDIVRRQTGGGAVFHDQEVTYSIHLPLALNLVPVKILDSYQRICQAIIIGLAEFNLTAQFVPLNDIVVHGKKISGNAQTRKKGIILQHGTILREVDVDKMFELLKVPNEKLKDKLISDVKQRVIGINQITAKPYTYAEVVAALIKGFKQEFSEIEFKADTLTTAEIELAQQLAVEKYSNNNWTNQR